MRQWRTHISKGDTQYMNLLFLATHLHKVFRMPHKQRIPAEPQCMEVQGDIQDTKGECVTAKTIQAG